MELTPHFRVVRFSPTPEINEPVNVALLVIEEKARLVTDKEFQKLACVSPRFDTKILRSWLEQIQDELSDVTPEEAPAFLASRTAQIQVGEPQRLMDKLASSYESKLIDIYLRRQTRPHKTGDSHLKYVDTLLENALKKMSMGASHMLKRARPSDFMSQESLNLIAAKNIHFSRVLSGSKRLVLMDGLNLSVASKSQIRNRALDIGFGFYTFGTAKDRLERIEKREIARVGFIFQEPSMLDPELSYAVEQVHRDSDMMVKPSAGENVDKLAALLKSSSEALIA
ncbi:MAG TPA: hypothetical protein VJA21_12115 [Verrucomicrobiae bacterium]